MKLWIILMCSFLYKISNSQLLKNESSLTIQSHKPRSHVTLGTRLEYTLELVLNNDGNNGHLEVQINGTFLSPAVTPKLTQVTIKWKPMPGYPSRENDINEYNMEIDGKLSDSTTFTLMLPLVKEEKMLHGLTGVLELFVTDDASLGSLLRPFVYISYNLQSVQQQRSVIIGDYLFVELPFLTVSAADPPEIDMKQRTTVIATVSMPIPRLDTSMLKVFMPSNMTTAKKNNDVFSGELFMTLVDFTYTQSTGLTKDSNVKVSRIVPSIISNSKSSEQDVVVVGIPDISAYSTPAEISFETKAEMLDFDGAYPGIQLNMVHILQIQSGIFVVQHTPVLNGVVHEEERTPNLTASLQIIDTYSEPNLFVVHLQVGVDHRAESWGSAYDITLELYLPSFLNNATLGKYSDVIRSDGPVLTTWDEVVVEIKMKRLSFAHSARVSLNISVDTDNAHYIMGEKYSLVTEVIYSGWRTQRLFKTLEQFQIKLGDTVDDEDCDEEDATESDECDDECALPWDCYTTLPGHGKRSSLKDHLGNEYICSAADREAKSWQLEPCLKIAGDKTLTAMDPGLGTLLGITDTAMYGIARNGMAYMMRPADSQLWYGIDEDVYLAASNEKSFTAAKFSKNKKGM